MKVRIAAVAGASLLGAVALALPGTAGGNKYASETTTRQCGEGDAVKLDGPLKLWPPNHKFVPEPVTATESADADSLDNVSITVTPASDDAVGGDGGSQHDPDWQLADGTRGATFTKSGPGTATAELQFRSERSGKGDGRKYTINWTATFDNGAKKCSTDAAVDSTGTAKAPFVIEVPHDMGKRPNA